MPKTKPTEVGAPRGVRSRAAKSGVIRARIDSELKAQAETILDDLGLNASEAIRIYYKQITMSKGIPFPVEIPNAETREAMRDAAAGKLNRYGSPAEMFEKLGI